MSSLSNAPTRDEGDDSLMRMPVEYIGRVLVESRKRADPSFAPTGAIMASMEMRPVQNAAWAGIRGGIAMGSQMRLQGVVPVNAKFSMFLENLGLAAWDDLQKLRDVFREAGIQIEAGDSWVYVIHPDQYGLVWQLMGMITDVVICSHHVPSSYTMGPRFDLEDSRSVLRVRENLLRILVDVAKESPWHARRE